MPNSDSETEILQELLRIARERRDQLNRDITKVESYIAEKEARLKQ